MSMWKNSREPKRGSGDPIPPIPVAPSPSLRQRVQYYIAERRRTLLNRPAFTIAFLPERPQPRHLIWGANHCAGGKIIKDPHKADAVFYFEEKTKTRPPGRPNPMAPGFNFFCPDLSQSRIASAFKTVFGYDLAVDPETHSGPMTVKTGRDGIYDGAVEDGPTSRKPRKTYQRLVDNEIYDGYVVKFRCIAVKGELPLVYVAMRPIAQRFGNINTSVAIVPNEEVFSSYELDKISRFCSEIGLDCGGLDILRDKVSGRIYIVDVDKADIIPPHALTLGDHLRSTEILGEALKEAIIDQPGILARFKQDLRADNDTGAEQAGINIYVVPDIPARVGS